MYTNNTKPTRLFSRQRKFLLVKALFVSKLVSKKTRFIVFLFAQALHGCRQPVVPSRPGLKNAWERAPLLFE